jgi:hypothetical protein
MANKSRRIRWTLLLSTVGEIRKPNKLLIGETKGKRPFLRREGNKVEMFL